MIKLKNKSIIMAATFFICVTLGDFTVPIRAFNTSNCSTFKKEETFFEKHPTVLKFLKFLGVAAGITVGSAGIYYSGRWGLDKLNPERVENRKNSKLAKSMLPGLRTELFRQGTTPERKNELRQQINDCKDAMNSVENSWDTVTGIAGIGGALTVAKFGFDSIDTIGSLAKKLLNISFLKVANDQMKQVFNGVKGLFDTPATELNKEEAFANFDKVFEGLEGQKEAEAKIKSYLYDIVVAKNQAKWKNEKYNHGNVLYFYGPSGVGKSFVSQRLPYALYSQPKTFVVTASDVDKEKKESIVSQLFGTNKNKNVNPYFPTPEKTKGIVDYLKDNPGGLVRIEEYDKFCTPALDEVFRTIMEHGIVNIDGEKIDCSGTTFILTSNEDNMSMEGFDKDDVEKLDKISISKGYTRVWHDKSFLNRVKKVEFKNLTFEEYSPIIIRHFEDMASYWGDSKNAGIKLKISNETVLDLAKQIEEINQGARPIDLWIIPEIQMSLGDKIKVAPDYDFYRNKTLTVVYDNQNRKLCVCEN